MKARVAIVQELLPQYRIPFFGGLRTALATDGIEVELLHGRARGERAARADEASLPWATAIDNRAIRMGEVEVLYQPVLRRTRGADLVVVEHANRLLVNYLLLARARTRRPRVAMWGHGGNLQSQAPDGPAERFKRRVATLPHWWFAYTQGSADRVTALGYPNERVTVVQNAVDTSAYARVLDGTTRRPSSCVYVGSLHQDKRIPFLLDAAAQVASTVPDFHLDVVGDGEYRDQVIRAAERHRWLRYHGALFGFDKARVVAEAQLLLMPGLVGLAAVEAVAARTPIVTTDVSYHSPEIEYLNQDNAVVLPADSTAEEYGQAVADLLGRGDELHRLREGCAHDAARLTMESMVQNFAAGLRAAVAAAPH